MTTTQEGRTWLPVIAALLAMILAGVAFIAGQASAATGPRYIMGNHDAGGTDYVIILDQETDDLFLWRNLRFESGDWMKPHSVSLRWRELEKTPE